MVNNSTNFNKANNHLSSYLTEHKKTTTYDIRNPAPGLRQEKKVEEVKPVNGIPTFPSYNGISNDTADINKW